MKYEIDIPLSPEFIKMIIAAIPTAYHLYNEHYYEENFPTDNGKYGELWNYINKCIVAQMPNDKFQVVIIDRGIWKFLGIYDRNSKYLYTLMRDKNLRNIRRTISEHLFHYLNALSKLNDSLANVYQPIYRQMTLFNYDEYDDLGNDKLDKILSSMIREIEGEIVRYVLITFDVNGTGQVVRINGIIPAKGLDYYREENWGHLVAPDYNTVEEVEIENGVSENAILLRRKPQIKRVKKDKDKDKSSNE